MLHLHKPQHLKPGDKVATVSLSWGAAGRPDIRWRYELGKRRIEKLFGLQVVEMPHTLAPETYVKDHPEIEVTISPDGGLAISMVLVQNQCSETSKK